MGALESKVAVITGGNSGIGLAAAQRLCTRVRMCSSRRGVRRNWTKP